MDVSNISLGNKIHTICPQKQFDNFPRQLGQIEWGLGILLPVRVLTHPDDLLLSGVEGSGAGVESVSSAWFPRKAFFGPSGGVLNLYLKCWLQKSLIMSFSSDFRISKVQYCLFLLLGLQGRLACLFYSFLLICFSILVSYSSFQLSSNKYILISN